MDRYYYPKTQVEELLQKLWERQRHYNQELENLCPDRTNPSRWTEVLLLGLISEAEEVLREIGWKRHRGNSSKRKIPRQNLAYELADLTKYVLSLWQVWGFNVDDMLLESLRKSYVMEMRLRQEFSELPQKGTRVLVTDLDGTLADLRYSLWEFLRERGIVDEVLPATTSLNADVDLGIDYRTFQDLKEKFIEEGRYANLMPFAPACQAVELAIADGVYVIAVTARPADRYPRLWLETMSWLEDQGLKVDQLHIGSDARIRILLELAEAGCDVVLFDDDPDLIERALSSGIKVVIRQYPYNAHLWHRERATVYLGGDDSPTFPFENSQISDSSVGLERSFSPKERRVRRRD